MVQRILRTAGTAIAAILVVCILLVVTDANEDNGLVHAILEIGRFFAAPFRGIFQLDDNHAQIAINWGIAAAVYAAAGALLASAVALVGRRRGGETTTAEAA